MIFDITTYACPPSHSLEEALKDKIKIIVFFYIYTEFLLFKHKNKFIP